MHCCSFFCLTGQSGPSACGHVANNNNNNIYIYIYIYIYNVLYIYNGTDSIASQCGTSSPHIFMVTDQCCEAQVLEPSVACNVG